MSVFAGLVLSIVLLAGAARADDATAQRVEDLKHRGNQAMMDLNYAEALAAYQAAIALTPGDAVLYYNLGRAHQAREDYPAALDALDTFELRASPELRGRVPKLAELIADVRAKVATLAITCTANVADGTVMIGERSVLTGCTPSAKQVRISVPARRATVDVRLVADGYQAQNAHIVVDGGTTTNVTLAVLARSTSGLLVVHALPAESRITVDGVDQGNPPLELPLAAGPHALDVRADHHEAKHFSVVIEAGRTKDIPVTLQRSAPITSKWWFWTGVGIVAVGVGVTIWYLVAQPESSASKGTIDPGQVSAPLVRF